jgi:four helix bundle protein
MQDYTRLLVWQRARSLTVSVYEATRRFPNSSAPGLRAQVMRSTMSIASNIAEGAARESRLDFARFVTIAIASTSETEHHLSVCSDLGLVEGGTADRLMARCTELRRMLFALRRAVIAAETDRVAPASVAGRPGGPDP